LAAGEKLKILLLCTEAALHINTVVDHVSAVRRFSKNEITIVDSVAFAVIAADLGYFDCIVLHYSMALSLPTFMPETLAKKISEFKGLKAAYIQDEHRWVDQQNRAIEALGLHIVFTATNPEVTLAIYREPFFENVRFVHTLTGFVSENLRNRTVPSYCDRALDVVYRGRKLPAWHGAFAAQKWEIAERFADDAKPYGLITDIETAESSRIYGEPWNDFLASAKATLGTESGASFVDFTGEVQKEAEAYEAAHPELSQAAIRERFLGDQDGKIVIRVISPRVFEAASLRTLMIMYEGAYSGVVEPWSHYVPLKEDHSNMDEIVSVLRDAKRAENIINRAYHEIALSPKWMFAAMVEQFDVVIHEEFGRRGCSNGQWEFVLKPLEAAISVRGRERLRRCEYLETYLVPAYEKLQAHQDRVQSRPLRKGLRAVRAYFRKTKETPSALL
jgi:hypothetical protein